MSNSQTSDGGAPALLAAEAAQHLARATIAVAAGGILAMISDTMMPEAFEEGHDFIGVVTVLGFLSAFILTKLGG